MSDWKCFGFGLIQLRDILKGRTSFRSKVNLSIPSVLQMTAQLGALLYREISLSLRVEVDAIFISMVVEQLAEHV